MVKNKIAGSNGLRSEGVNNVVIQNKETRLSQKYLVLLSVHFKHRDVTLPVDLIPGRVSPHTLGRVPPQDRGALHVLQAELADVELGEAGVLLGVRGAVPRAQLKPAKLYLLQNAVVRCIVILSLLEKKKNNAYLIFWGFIINWPQKETYHLFKRS